ncbi:hypothetical protein EJD97_002274 [Solanum chilense]|uniref:Uncharacterized protein n=1 Tax=Solanum chilense TaxID=4083 RepID=A0A6N2ANQ5_SOLCI|nr:hypothetical protein EJD97_002274 [Solanum chilense]
MCVSDMNTQQAEEESEMGKQMPLNLSKDQYEQLLNILGTIQPRNGGFNSDDSNSMLSGAVNLAGILIQEHHII